MLEHFGRVAYIDLTSGNIKVTDLEPEVVSPFIGDGGISFRLAYDLIKPGTAPLSPENPIIIGVSPLVGTRIQAPRWSVVSKFPLTGCVAYGSGGMGFGVRLKRAGYDQVVITGRAPKPVYLKICDDDLDICDAGDLWGMDIYETTDVLWQKLGKKYSIAAMGQSGENLVAISLALIDKIGSLGKGGLPAIMGSKNLKAIAVMGTKEVPIADPSRFDKICGEIVQKYIDDPARAALVKLGKMGSGKKNVAHASNPYKNFTENFSPDRYQELYGTEVYLNTIESKRLGCATCIYPCKDMMTVQKGDYKGLTTYLSSLTGRMRNLGIQCSAGCSFEELVKLVDITNRYGIDTQSFAPTMMLAVELYERGILTKKDTEGLALKSDFETTVALLEKTVFRQGIGDVLADGSMGIIKRFGKEYEKYSFHIKGLPQQIDARLHNFNMMTFCQITNPEGASIEPAHVGLNWYPRKEGFSLNVVREFARRMDLSKEATDKIFDTPSGFNVARLTKVAEDFHMVLNSLGVCENRNEFWDWNKFAEVYSSVTGIEMTGTDMKKAGERIWNLFKVLNVREGFSRKDDTFPQRWLEPLRTASGEEIIPMTCGGEVATAEVLNKLLDDYYEERGWDIEKGIPTREKLISLGLINVVNDFEKSGILQEGKIGG